MIWCKVRDVIVVHAYESVFSTEFDMRDKNVLAIKYVRVVTIAFRAQKQHLLAEGAYMS